MSCKRIGMSSSHFIRYLLSGDAFYERRFYAKRTFFVFKYSSSASPAHRPPPELVSDTNLKNHITRTVFRLANGCLIKIDCERRENEQPVYADRFKIRPVNQVVDHGHSVADVAERLVTTTHSLYTRIRKFRFDSAEHSDQGSQYTSHD